MDARGEGHTRHGILRAGRSTAADPPARISATGIFDKPRHLLDRPVETRHIRVRARARARNRRSRTTPGNGAARAQKSPRPARPGGRNSRCAAGYIRWSIPIRAPWRDSATPADAHDLHPRIFAVALPLGDFAVEQIEHFRVFCRRAVEHGVDRAAFGVERRSDIPAQQFAGRDGSEQHRRERAGALMSGKHEDDDRKDQHIALLQASQRWRCGPCSMSRDIRKRQNANGGDRADHRQRAPDCDTRKSLADEIRKQMSAQKREDGDEHEARHRPGGGTG